VTKATAHPAVESAPGVALIATKLRPPPSRRTLIARPHLLRLLEVETLPKVTLVDAPAGSGKTTLLVDWFTASDDRPRIAWLSLDRADNDQARFWTYLIHALRTVEPALGEEALTALRYSGQNAVELVLVPLVNELERLERELVLVLDDYHLLTSAELHEGMAFLVEHLPARLRLVLASRSDPPLPLAQLRVRGQLLELRTAELRFSTEEATLLLNDILELNIEPAEVALLRRRTEGWAAGLYLAGLTLQGRADTHQFISAFAGDNRYVVDYLGAEVLAAQPEDVRAFLLQTSLLDRFCAPLCDEVTGGDGSAAMLRRIEQANLFLVPLDEQRRWYRYHHLFGELLRHELRQTAGGLVATLHRRAAGWLLREGDVSEAIHHTAAAGDGGRAAELIALHWPTFLQQGELGTVAGWLDALPEGVVARDPRLCLTRAWLAVNDGLLDEIERWAGQAARAARSGAAADAAPFEAAAGMLRCIQRYLEGDVGEAIAAARRAGELEPEERAPWRSVGCPVLGIALFWRGQIPDAQGTLERALTRAAPAGNHIAVIHAQSCLAAIHAERGELDGAARLARAAIESSRERRLDEHWATTMAHVARAKVLEEQGLLAEAEQELVRAVALSRRGVARVEIAYALLGSAKVRHALGDEDGARAVLGEARRAVADCPDPGILDGLVAAAERRLASREQASAGAAEPLTERELAVVRLFPTELSLREIASALYVSLNTVKTHTRSIYRKLGASSRAEAVERARAAGLLDRTTSIAR
jgi:LuxR family maltose regulon positive regulatory protein